MPLAAAKLCVYQDRNLHGSSTTQIAELLEAHAPCLILLDELLQYLTKPESTDELR